MTTLMDIFAAAGILAGACSPLGAPGTQPPATWSVVKGLPVMLAVAPWQSGWPAGLPPLPSDPPPLGGITASIGPSGALRIAATDLVTGVIYAGELPPAIRFAVSGQIA